MKKIKNIPIVPLLIIISIFLVGIFTERTTMPTTPTPYQWQEIIAGMDMESIQPLLANFAPFLQGTDFAYLELDLDYLDFDYLLQMIKEMAGQ